MFTESPTELDVCDLENGIPQRGQLPIPFSYSSDSSIYLRYSIVSFEAAYLRFTSCTILGAISPLVKSGNRRYSPMFASLVSILGVIPCAYLIGICVDDLSHQLGLVLGLDLNSVFLTIAELIPYWFPLEEEGLADVVRAAITRAFLMNLLLVPGFGMLAAGLKWSEVVLNKR